MKICWVIYNSDSNKIKLKRFKEHAAKSKLIFLFYESKNCLLRVSSNGKEVIIDAKTGKKLHLPDFIVALIPEEKFDRHGYKLLDYLENKGVTLLNSVANVRLVTDKYQTNVLLSKHGFRVPDTLLFSKESNTKSIIFPCVIKPIDGRKSRGVRIINSKLELKKYFVKTQEDLFVIQKFISESYRKDIRAFIFDGVFLGAVHRTARTKTFGSVLSKPIALSEDMKQTAVKVANLLGLTFCSVDFFVDEQNTICEVNANPGFKSLEQHVAKDLLDKIDNFFLSKGLL